MKNIIEVKKLVKRYKKAEVNAVDNVSFDVVEGEFFAFLGPNGAGKTTTISVLTTTLSKTSGNVTIAGYDLEKEPSKVRQNIGVIFQKPSLDENLTAEENVRLHTILYGLYPFRPAYSLMPNAYRKRIKKLAQVLEIEKDIFNPIKTFSGGMKRKLEIIRSLMHNPKILFLDEPTSGLDPISRKNLWAYLQTVRKEEHVTIFLTTHYLEEAEEADHIAIIDDGKIISCGTKGEIQKDLVQHYLIIDASDRDSLRKEIEAQKLNYTKKDGFEIPIQKRSIQDVIKGIGTQLTKISIHDPTLEEAYLDIIEANQQKKKHDKRN